MSADLIEKLQEISDSGLTIRNAFAISHAIVAIKERDDLRATLARQDSSTVVSEMTGRSLSRPMQLHLLNDSLFADTDLGPLSTLTGDVYRLLEAARKAGDNRSSEILVYIHERICRARHEIAGDETRELPAKPEFLSKATA